MSIIIAIIIFGLIIIIHELGHFLLAKKNGIRVEEFSIGLGPTLVGFTRGETKYSIKLLPFGGACMMTGEDGESKDPKAFVNKGVWARISVVFAGPAFNFLLAFVLSFIMISMIGYDAPIISEVIPESSAQEAGMEAGDRIVRIDGTSIHVYRDISAYLTLHPNKTTEELTVVYERNGERYTTELTPKYSEENGRYLLGVTGGIRSRGNLLQIIGYSANEVRYWIGITLNSLKLIVTGNVALSDVSGPVGIVDTIHTTYQESSAISIFAVVVNMLNISILLTANLGVMNLLPLPALDGGRLVFLIIELIRGKAIDPEKEGSVHVAGFLILLGLMVIIMFKDIITLFIS